MLRILSLSSQHRLYQRVAAQQTACFSSQSLTQTLNSLKEKKAVRRGDLDAMIEKVQDAADLTLIEQAFRVYEQKFVDPNEGTMRRFAQAYVRVGQASAFLQQLAHMKDNAFRAVNAIDKCCYTAIMKEFLKTKDNEKVIEAYEQMKERNVSVANKPFVYAL